MGELIPYCESITKLPASELLEEGTQCPNCYTEIFPHDSIYLHRGCANILCSSCFDSSMSSELRFGICLICDSNLAEPCIDDAIPNWRFTYTNLPLPGYRFHFDGSRQRAAETGSSYNVAEGLGSMVAELARQRADLIEQRSRMRGLKNERFPDREDNQNSTKFWHQDNNPFQHHKIPRFQRQDDANAQSRYNCYPRNQYGTRPRLVPSQYIRHYTSYEHENNINARAHHPRNTPNWNRSDQQREDTSIQRQRQRHAHNRRAREVRPYSRGESDGVQYQPVYTLPAHYNSTLRFTTSSQAHHSGR